MNRSFLKSDTTCTSPPIHLASHCRYSVTRKYIGRPKQLELGVSCCLLYIQAASKAESSVMQSYNPQHFDSTHSRWRAITQRDPTAHFSFIYGVITTRIYCRPTCTARVARRANIVYYETPANARVDGYRPCTKCKPDDSTFMGQREEIVLRTLDLLRDDLGNAGLEGGVKALAESVGVTPSYLCRVFKTMMGCTISQYRRQFDGVQVHTGEANMQNLPTTPTPPRVVTSTVLPKSMHPAVEPLVSADHFPETPSEHSVQPWTGIDCSFDSDRDFDEWLWIEDMACES